jgi:hypothetical protein
LTAKTPWTRRVNLFTARLPPGIISNPAMAGPALKGRTTTRHK